MYPTFCSYQAELEDEESFFANVAAASGPGQARPGLALGEHEGRIEVLVAPDGRTAIVQRAAVQFGLPEAVALAMMDAVEEAIEDTRDEFPNNTTRLTLLETTLHLLERALDA